MIDSHNRPHKTRLMVDKKEFKALTACFEGPVFHSNDSTEKTLKSVI